MTLIDDLFYSVDAYGYIGPIGMLILGYFIAKKEPVFGVFYYVLLIVMAFSYLGADFVAQSWKFFTLVFGGAAVCLLPSVERR